MKVCEMCGIVVEDISINYVDLNIEVVILRNELKLCDDCGIYKKIKVNDNGYLEDIKNIRVKEEIKDNYYYGNEHVYKFYKKVENIYVFKEFLLSSDNSYMVDLGIFVLWEEKERFNEVDIITKKNKKFIELFFKAKLNELFFIKSEHKNS